MCWKLLKKLFRHSKEQEPTLQVAPEKKPRRWWEFLFRRVKTSRGGLNMPRYQPCPGHGARAKRQFKTDFGASYLCRCGRSFVVSR